MIIFFTQQADSALLDIEKKYNLEEEDKEWIEKLKAGKQLNQKIVLDLIQHLAKKEISEKDFNGSLQKDLNMSKEISEKIFAEISNNVLPFLKEVSEEDVKNGLLPDVNGEQKKSAGASAGKIKPLTEINLTNEVAIIQSSKTPDEISVPKRKTAREIKKTPPRISSIEKKGARKQPDTYREPLE